MPYDLQAFYLSIHILSPLECLNCQYLIKGILAKLLEMKFECLLILVFACNIVFAQENMNALLMQEIKKCNIEEVKEIIQKGGNVNAKDKNGATPLMLAIDHCDLEMVKYLVDKGADTHAKGLIYWDSIYAVKGYIRHNINNYDPFGNLSSVAVARNKMDVLQYLIDSCGVTMEDRSFAPGEEDVMVEATAFHWAAYLGNERFLKYLALAGADINATTSGGMNALHLANFSLDTGIVKLLVNMGVSLNSQETDGFTPLMIAAFLGNTEIVQILLESGADIDLKDKNNQTAADIAKSKGDMFIFDLLKKNETQKRRPPASDVLTVVQSGHKTWTSCVKFSKDGKYLFSGGWDKNIILWEVSTALEIRTFKGLPTQVNDITLSPDGKLVVGCSLAIRNNQITGEDENSILNQNIIAWNVSSGSQVMFYKGISWPTSVVFSPDQKYIVGSGPSDLVVWETSTGQIIANMDISLGFVSKTKFSADGKKIIMVEGERIKILDFDKLCNGKVTLVFEVTSVVPGSPAEKAGLKLGDKITKVDNVCFTNPDDLYSQYKEENKKYIFTIERDNAVRDIPIFKTGATFGIRYTSEYVNDTVQADVAFADSVYCFDMNPNDQTLITGHENGAIKLWGIQTGEFISIIGQMDDAISSVACSPNGKYIAVGSRKKLTLEFGIIIWDIEKKTKIFSTEIITFTATSDFTFDSKFFVCSGDFNPGLWEMETCKKVKSFMGNSLFVNCAAFSPDNNSFVSSVMGIVLSWSLATGSMEDLCGGYSLNTTLVHEESGQYIVSGNDEGNVIVWDQKNSEIAHILITHKSGLFYADFDPKHKIMVTMHKDDEIDQVILWNIENNKKIRSYKGNINKQLTINQITNKLCWTIGQKKIDLIKAKKHFAFSFETDYFFDFGALAFSLDGKYKALCADSEDFANYDVDIWDLQTGEIVSRLAYHNDYVSTICFSPDNKTVATGSWDNTIKIWDFRTGKLLYTLDGHKYRMRSVRFNYNGKYLISTSYDNTVKIWDMEKVQDLCTFVVGEHGKYLIYNNDGYYWSNKESLSLVHFVKGDKSYSFDQFDLRLNRPDLILHNLPNANQDLIDLYYKAYNKRLQKMKFTEKMLSKDFHVPDLKIDSHVPASLDKNKLDVLVKVADTMSTIDRLNIFVNDVPIYGIKGIDLRPKNTQQHEQTLEIELAPGENKIQVSVLNQAGAESLKETVYVTCTAPARKPDLYLIGIGSGQFRNTAMNLDFPAKDVRDFAGFFQKNESHYANIFVDTLLNCDLTQSKLTALKAKLLHSKVDDHVILYVAGHGILNDSLDYYLPTYETDFKAPSHEAIPYEALEDLLDAIPARQKLLLVDACHAGELDKENVTLAKEQQTIHGTIKFRTVGPNVVHKKIGLENSFELMKELFVDLRRGTGATVIAGAGGVQAALEGGQWNNSVFMYALLSGLRDKKADTNKDGAIMVSELQAFLGQEVERLTNGAQRPTSRLENITNDWRIW